MYMEASKMTLGSAAKC